MKFMLDKRFILLAALVLILIGGFAVLYAAEADETGDGQADLSGFQQEVLVKGKVVEIISEDEIIDPLSQNPVMNQILKVRIDSGRYKGKEIAVINYQTDNPVFNLKISEGDGVIVALEMDRENDKIKEAYIADHLRQDELYLLLLIFMVLVLAIGWRKGAKALCALLLTMVLIWGGLLPGFLHGYNPLFLTAVIAIIATVVTLLIVGGRSLKSITAIVGTLGGVAVAGGLALVVGKAAYLTGFGSEEAAMLLYIPQADKLDIQGLLFAGIIIGALGASMDVSMSIASAVEEIKRVCPELGIWKLFQSGMNVGRDVMGTMVNTLILAYTGSSLQLILIFMAYRETLLKIFNLDAIASEVVRALSGSIGMIMVIPLTSIVAAILFGRNKQQRSEVEDAEVKEINGQ